MSDSAFPRPTYVELGDSLNSQTGVIDSSEGLTKREFYAAMALQGLISDNHSTYDQIIEMSVRLADGLIKELSKEDPNKVTNPKGR